jgi:SnoaL-like domain
VRLDTIAQRFEALETRIRELEDRLAIHQLLAGYGPAVDSLNGDAVARLWTEDGRYDTGYGPTGALVLTGAEALAGIVDHPDHLDFIARGCGHVISSPYIVLDGDRATATSYSRVFAHDGGEWRIVRMSANLWRCARTADGWRVVDRINRPLDGTEPARTLLGAAL